MLANPYGGGENILEMSRRVAVVTRGAKRAIFRSLEFAIASLDIWRVLLT